MKLWFFAGWGLLAASLCRGQHVDVQLQVNAGKIEVGRIDFSQPGNPVDPTWRVFEAAFGEVPNYTDDPGFNASSTSGLPGNTLLGFNILDGVRKWDAGAGVFGPVIPGAITVQLGGVVFAPSPAGCNQVQAGFAFARTSGSGGVHQHVQYFLNAPASAGVYLLKLEVYAEHPAIQASDPFWVVFSQNSLAERAAAAAYVRGLLEPGACAGDVNDDGFVNGADLSVLLGGFGTCVMKGTSADFNADGMINGADLSVLLSNFGAGC
jgi:hypothetical protein